MYCFSIDLRQDMEPDVISRLNSEEIIVPTEGPSLRRSERIKKLKEKKKLEMKIPAPEIKKRARVSKRNCTKSKKPRKNKPEKCNNRQSARAMDLPTWYSSYFVGNNEYRSGSSARERRAGCESQRTNNVVCSPCIGCNENEVRSVHQYHRQPRVKRNDGQGQGRPDVPLAENMMTKSTPTEREVERICGIIDRDGTTYLLVEWQDSMSPEYVEFKNATPPMIEMMQKFLCVPRSKDTMLIKDESTHQQDEVPVNRYTQAQMNILEDSSLLIGMESKTVHIKIE
ncbi:hypothetical protein CDAR_394722 [Caerostris darwini]|uniref:Chromo shadow domain-containing protein n=1 Tax=Caerostris darwini TaxID=1538125 RepID=A0AAV4PBY2_9ARAC|nr:hypothetical protein CDAR_394722 [Caerostris darwini]